MMRKLRSNLTVIIGSQPNFFVILSDYNPKFSLRKKQHIERNREFFAGNADFSTYLLLENADFLTCRRFDVIS